MAPPAGPVPLSREAWKWHAGSPNGAKMRRGGYRLLRHVMRDDLLMAIAKRQPTNRRGLEAPRLQPARAPEPRPGDRDDSRSGPRVPEEQLPEISSRPEEPPGISTVTNLLSAALAQCCAQKQIAGSMVANLADLKQLIRWHLDGRSDTRLPALLEGWRSELCGRHLLDVLEGGSPCGSSTRRASFQSHWNRSTPPDSD